MSADETESGGPDPERLEKLENDIEQARAHAEEADTTDGVTDEPRFKQRGELSDEAVDDVIAPPG